jgi:hypothetical protein
MATNTNSRAHAAYLGRITPDGYVIVAAYKGRRADEEVARFDSYDDMLREWYRITELCGMVDVFGTD